MDVDQTPWAPEPDDIYLIFVPWRVKRSPMRNPSDFAAEPSRTVISRRPELPNSASAQLGAASTYARFRLIFLRPIWPHPAIAVAIETAAGFRFTAAPS
jgi:hypothetical protein